MLVCDSQEKGYLTSRIPEQQKLGIHVKVEDSSPLETHFRVLKCHMEILTVRHWKTISIQKFGRSQGWILKISRLDPKNLKVGS